MPVVYCSICQKEMNARPSCPIQPRSSDQDVSATATKEQGRSASGSPRADVVFFGTHPSAVGGSEAFKASRGIDHATES